VPDFSYLCCKSYVPAKFIEVETFHPLHLKNHKKVPDMFKGGTKICQAAVVFFTYSVFCCFERLFESQDDSF
jgi:hypothetical protein